MPPKTPRDYLKYWKVIRQYYKSKFKLSQSDLDMLLFMYSEKYFTRERFVEFNNLVGWDTMRFQRMMKNGYFEIFRKGGAHEKYIYKMSDKGKLLVSDIYRKLNGEDIPMTVCNNPMLKRKAKYSERVYIDMIAEMREFNKQQRHQSLE